MGPFVTLIDHVQHSTSTVVPVLVGPLQVLLMFLPAIALAVGGILLRLLSPSGFAAMLRLLWRLKLHLLVIAAVVVGGWWAMGAMNLGSTGVAAVAEKATTTWSCFRGDAGRSGAVAGSPAPANSGLVWGSLSSGMREDCVMSSPAVVGNRVYVATARVAIGGGSGAIYAYDADSGAQAWRFEPPGYRPTFSSPAVDGKWLAIGEGLHTTSDARVVVLDISNDQPRLAWMHATTNHVESSPAIADGRVFVGAGDDGYYAFALEGDGAGNSKVLWHLSGDRYRDCECSPVVHQGKVFVGLGLEGHALLCIDAATGKEDWRISTPAPVFAAPSVYQGRVYVGMGYGDFVNPADHAREGEREKMQKRGKSEAEIVEMQKGYTTQGAVWCIDLATQNVVWKAATPKAVLCALVVDERGVLAASADGTVLALGHDGKELARRNAGGALKASPAVADGKAYLVNDQGRCLIVERESLKPLHEGPIGTPGPYYFSAPAIARGHLYVGTNSDGLVCVGQPAAATASVELWPGEQAGPGAGGTLQTVPLAKQGEMLWNLPEGQQDSDKDPLLVSASPALVGGDLFVAQQRTLKRGLACLGIEVAGKAMPKQRWYVETAQPIRRSPAVVGDRVLVVDGLPGETGRHLRCVQRSDGSERWKLPIADAAGGWLSVSEHEVLVEDAPGKLRRVALDGKPMWQADCGGALAAPATVTGELVLVATATPPALVVLDRQTGTQLWRVAVKATPTTSPLLRAITVQTGDAKSPERTEQRILVGSDAGLLAHLATTGAAVGDWQAPAAAVAGGAFVSTPRIIAYAGAGAVQVLDPVTGKLLAKHSQALPVAPVRARETVLFAGAAGLMRLSESDPSGAPQLWCDSSWLGTPSTALIAAGDGVLGGFGAWGLVLFGGSK